MAKFSVEKWAKLLNISYSNLIDILEWNFKRKFDLKEHITEDKILDIFKKNPDLLPSIELKEEETYCFDVKIFLIKKKNTILNVELFIKPEFKERFLNKLKNDLYNIQNLFNNISLYLKKFKEIDLNDEYILIASLYKGRNINSVEELINDIKAIEKDMECIENKEKNVEEKNIENKEIEKNTNKVIKHIEDEKKNVKNEEGIENKKIILKKFSIEHFKSLNAKDTEFGNYNIIIGENNAGKTSFLLAIYFYLKALKKILKHLDSKNNEIFIEKDFWFPIERSSREFLKNSVFYKGNNRKNIKLKGLFKINDKENIEIGIKIGYKGKNFYISLDKDTDKRRLKEIENILENIRFLYLPRLAINPNDKLAIYDKETFLEYAFEKLKNFEFSEIYRNILAFNDIKEEIKEFIKDFSSNIEDFRIEIYKKIKIGINV